MKIRCLLVDDEPLAISLVSSYIQQVPGLEIVQTCNSALEAFTVLQKQRIDLMFLDIKMPKMTGTDFLRSIPDPPKVIFITAYREYALDGFELDVVDYLLKPFSFNRFMKAVAKANKLLKLENQDVNSYGSNHENKNAFLYFKVDKEMTKVFIHEIVFIESRKEYVKLYMDNKSSLLVKQSISSMEKILSPHHFLRVHRSFIVTIEKIKSFTPLSVNVGDQKVPIGRLYKSAVEKTLKQ